MVNRFQDDANALGLALIITLLVIGGVEQNPGPNSSEQLPGPSFSGVTLMDVMEAIRITQFQIDGLSNRVNDLTKMIGDMSRSANQRLNHQRLDDSTQTPTPRSLLHSTPPATRPTIQVEARPAFRSPVSAAKSTCSPGLEDKATVVSPGTRRRSQASSTPALGARKCEQQLV